MFKQQISRFAMVAALVTSMGFMAPAVALAAGSGPGDAMAPTGNWEFLNIGQSHWYAFSSAGEDDDGDPSHVLITLYAQPEESIEFNVWTPELLAERALADDPAEALEIAPPLGSGSEVTITQGETTEYLFDHARIWAGGMYVPGTFFVEVYQSGDQAGSYLLQIVGDAVSFPTAAPASEATQAMAASMESAGGAASAPSSNWQHLNVGQSRWYEFSSAGEDEDGDPSHVFVTLYTQPEGSAGFNIWTPELLAKQAIADDAEQALEEAHPLGAGQEVEITEGGQTLFLFDHARVWAGGIHVPGTFLVEVYQTGTLPADYLLQITGDAVSF